MSYGWCRCGAKIKNRTRGLPSIDTCENGHSNDARITLKYDPTFKPAPEQVNAAPEFHTGGVIGKTPLPFKFPLDDTLFVVAPSGAYVYKKENDENTKFVSPEPQPTPYEAEILDILIEECAEIIQRATKMKRFGVMEVQPGQDFTNHERLSHEIGDFFATLERAAEAGLICEDSIAEQIPIKLAKLTKFLQNEKDAL